MTKKKPTGKKKSSTKKQKSSQPKPQKGSVPMKDKSEFQEELDKTRAAQANRSEHNDPANMREDVRELLDRQGPGTVHNAPEQEDKIESDTEAPKSPDQIAAEAKEAGVPLTTTIDPNDPNNVVDKASETKDDE